MNIRARQYERWDNLCQRIYGRSTQADVMTLRDANRELVRGADAQSQTSEGVTFEFNGGELITVPMLDIQAQSIDAGVAPWQK